MKKKDNKELLINYGTGVLSLPLDALHLCDKAEKTDLLVLMMIASSEHFRSGDYAKKISREIACDASSVERSVAFWCGAGILSLNEGSVLLRDTEAETAENKKEKNTEEDKQPDKKGKNVPKRARVSELPQYTSAELNALLEQHAGVVGLIDECQNILGKIFTAADIKVLMGFVDYLGLDNDYILVLMHYAARKEVKSMRYIEKVAVSCLDDGITDAAVLQDYLLAKEEKDDAVHKIKNAFGIGTRKLTAKETKCTDTWINEYKFELAVIEKAYEITIGATSKPSIPYAHAILERWYTEGARTVEDVDAMLAQRELEKEGEGSSFDVDDFFNAAMQRSYADKK